MEFIILLIVAIIFLIPFWVLVCLDREEYWTKKRTYMVIWRYNALCPSSTVIVEAKSLVKAWEKVQKQHSIPIDLVSIKEI